MAKFSKSPAQGGAQENHLQSFKNPCNGGFGGIKEIVADLSECGVLKTK